MNTTLRLMAVLLAGLPAAAAMAADTTAVDRNGKQQERIEQGLQSGALNTREAARLEKQQSKIEQMEAHASRDGQVSSKEAARIQQAQNTESQWIRSEKHDAQRGNPKSVSSLRMQSDVAHNINQQTRIRNGLADGSLTTHEAGRMERQQASGDRKLARAGSDGYVGPGEQRRVVSADNRQSRHIWHQRHDAQQY